MGRTVRGDSVPIKKFKTKQNPKGEYMPYPTGPVQHFPQAKKKKLDKSFKEGYG